MTIYVISPNYPGCLAGSDGTVIGPRGKVLTPPIDNGHGYLYVNVRGGKRQKHVYIHRLICEAFWGPCPDGMEAAHKDGNQADCSAANVAWKTHAENIADKQTHGTQTKGAAHHSAVLTENQIISIRQRYATSQTSTRELAEQYGVSRGCIQKIIDGKSYVVEGAPVLDKTMRGKGSRHSKAKLTDGIVRSIRVEYAQGGITHQQLALKYGVATPTITYIINRKIWRHVA